MKIKVLLLAAIVPAILSGCGDMHRYAQYVYENQTGKAIEIAFYDETYYDAATGTVNPDARLFYSFVIAASERYYEAAAPVYDSDREAIRNPFENVGGKYVSVSNGEVVVVQTRPEGLFDQSNYVRTSEEDDLVWLLYVFTDDFFASGIPVAAE